MGKNADNTGDRRSASSAAHQDKLKAKSDKQDSRLEEKRIALTDADDSPRARAVAPPDYSLFATSPKKAAKRGLRDQPSDPRSLASPPWATDIMSMLHDLQA
eukprot:3078783-Amphidinium_carterae.1